MSGEVRIALDREVARAGKALVPVHIVIGKVKREAAAQLLVSEEHRESLRAAPRGLDVHELAILEIDLRDARHALPVEAARSHLKASAIHHEPMTALGSGDAVAVGPRIVVHLRVASGVAPVHRDSVRLDHAARVQIRLGARRVVGGVERDARSVQHAGDIHRLHGLRGGRSAVPPHEQFARRRQLRAGVDHDPAVRRAGTIVAGIDLLGRKVGTRLETQVAAMRSVIAHDQRVRGAGQIERHAIFTVTRRAIDVDRASAVEVGVHLAGDVHHARRLRPDVQTRRAGNLVDVELGELRRGTAAREESWHATRHVDSDDTGLHALFQKHMATRNAHVEVSRREAVCEVQVSARIFKSHAGERSGEVPRAVRVPQRPGHVHRAIEGQDVGAVQRERGTLLHVDRPLERGGAALGVDDAAASLHIDSHIRRICAAVAVQRAVVERDAARDLEIRLAHRLRTEHAATGHQNALDVDRKVDETEIAGVLDGEILAGAVDAPHGRGTRTCAETHIEAVDAADCRVCSQLHAAQHRPPCRVVRGAPVLAVVHDRAASVRPVAGNHKGLDLRDLKTRIGVVARRVQAVDVELSAVADLDLAARGAAVLAERMSRGACAQHHLLPVGDHDVLRIEGGAVERDRTRTAESDARGADQRTVAVEGVVARAGHGDRADRHLARHCDVARRRFRPVDERGHVRDERSRRATVIQPVRARRVPAEVGGARRTPCLRGHGGRNRNGHRQLPVNDGERCRRAITHNRSGVELRKRRDAARLTTVTDAPSEKERPLSPPTWSSTTRSPVTA